MRTIWHKLVAALAATAGLLLLGALGANAQDFPVKGKAITIIVPYAPGGGTDLAARIMAAGLEKELMTPVQVANKPGAASQLGMSELVRSPPDGYTLASAVLPTITTHYLDPARAAIYTRKDFQPVALQFSAQYFVAVRTDSPWKTLKDFVEAARAKPEGIKISDSGLLGTPHLHILMLEKAAGVKFASVHFAGGAPSVTALLGGHVDAVSGASNDVLPNKQSGNFRVLGVSGEQPDKSMPDVPTEKSLGYDVIASSATGFVAPAGTPQKVVDVLTRAMKKVIEGQEHQKKLDELGLQSTYLDPEAYAKLWIDIENRVKPILEQMKGK